MSENRTVKRFIPVSIYDIEGMESWLSDMAAEGLLLKGFGRFFAHFEKGEVQKVIYRVEPACKACEMPNDEILEYYKDSGWNYISHINKTFFIYRSTYDEMKEIHTDPVVQSYTYEALNRKLKSTTILVTILSLLVIGMILSIYLINEQPVLYMIQGEFINQLIVLILELFTIICSIRDARAVNKLLKQLKSGVPITHKRNYKKNKVLTISGYSLLVLASILIIILPILQIVKSWDKNIEDVTRPLPTISLDALEKNEGFRYHNEISYNGRNYDNDVIYDWSPLSPVQYKINQKGIIEDMMWEDNSGVYKPSLTTEYYKLSFSILAKPLMEDLIKRYIDPYDNMTMEELSVKGFDRAVLATKGESQQLFACKGNEVIYLKYYGYGVLKSKQDEIAGILNK